MRSFNNDDYISDVTDEINENYDIIDSDKKTYIASKTNMDEEMLDILWEDEANNILQDLGIDYYLEVSKMPYNRLERIRNYYEKKSWSSDNQGNIVYDDPMPYYYSSGRKPEVELFDLGYKLGEMGSLGTYYLLLPDINFSRGFWKGKFVRAVQEDNDEMILEISNEIKLFDSQTAEKELADIVNSVFTNEINEDEKKGKLH